MARVTAGRAGAVLLLGLAAAAAWGCDECRTSGDCPAGQVCVNGSCRPSGDQDADADAGDTGGDDGEGVEDPSLDPDGVDAPDGDVAGDDTGGEVPSDGEEDAPCTSDEECADTNPCTDDYCHLSFHVCVNFAVDGRDCDDGDLCNGVGTCDSTGACIVESSPLCDDLDDCTFDTCVSGGSDCTHDSGSMEGSSCDDALYCDGPDSCQGGICLPDDMGYAACDDGDTCTFDTCTEGTGGPVCGHELIGSFRAITCDTTVTGITSGTSGVSSYGSCTGTLGTSGPETVLVFGHDALTDVTFTLVVDPIPTADNNEMYLLTDGCDPSTCTDVGTPSVTYTGLPAGTLLYIGVESVPGGAYFAVRATCS